MKKTRISKSADLYFGWQVTIVTKTIISDNFEIHRTIFTSDLKVEKKDCSKKYTSQERIETFYLFGLPIYRTKTMEKNPF